METTTPKLILVPTDFSAPAAHALRYAAALGARFEAHLLVIYADLFMPYADLSIPAVVPSDITQSDRIEIARQQLTSFTESNIGKTLPHDIRVVVDTPADAILAQVRESGANVIVMGTHGRTGLRRLLFGSVTESVMRLAPVPVIAVHESTPDSAPMRVIVGSRSTPEARAAVEYAGILADVAQVRFVDAGDVVSLPGAARNEAA
ncbi:MAG TPA: universal stress protein, partial [Thermoanaerobaculia bacterium]